MNLKAEVLLVFAETAEGVNLPRIAYGILPPVGHTYRNAPQQQTQPAGTSVVKTGGTVLSVSKALLFCSAANSRVKSSLQSLIYTRNADFPKGGSP